MNMVTIWEEARGFSDLEPPADVRLALHAAELAILTTLTDDDLTHCSVSAAMIEEEIGRAQFLDPEQRAAYGALWSAGREGGRTWLERVMPLLPQQSEWNHVLGLTLTLWNPVIDEAVLGTGPVGTRVNTILDLLECGFTTQDSQTACLDVAVGIAEGKTTALEKGAMTAGRVAATGLAAWFGIPGEPVIDRAFSWVDGAAHEVDDWVLDLTIRYLLAIKVTEFDLGRAGVVRQGFFDEARRLGSGAANSRRVRMLIAAYAGIDPPEGETVTMPDVTEMRLGDALQILSALGSTPTIVDGLGADRSPMDKSKWIICGQLPEVGKPIGPKAPRVAFARPEDRLRGPQLDAILKGGEAVSAREPAPWHRRLRDTFSE